MDLSEWRHEYRTRTLRRTDLEPTPMAQLAQWIGQLQEADFPEPNAMVLGTVDAGGQSSQRTVLLKGLDERGLVFYTNYGSAKARDMEAEPRVSLLFPWHPVERQVKVLGLVTPVSREESGAYFAQRPRASQLGAWASEQSAGIASRELLEERLAEVTARFEGRVVPLPESWGGYRVQPREVEFWQGGPGRVHDRLVYRRDETGGAGGAGGAEGTGGAWQVVRLQP